MIQKSWKTCFRLLHAYKSTIKSGRQADLYIEPPGVDHYDILRLKYAEELFHIAYEHTKQLISSGF